MLARLVAIEYVVSWTPPTQELRMRIRSLQYVVLPLLLGAAVAAHAQTGTISGRVISESEQPIVGAQVRLVGTGLGTLTGDGGRYSIVNVPAAEYRIRAQMIGHRPVEVPVRVTA